MMRVWLRKSDAHSLLVFFFLGCLRSSATSALSPHAKCFYPDGAPAPGDFPCFLNQNDSACCGPGTICEASGLCKAAHSVDVSELIRGSCTDSSWASSSCPHYCTDADTGGTNIISCRNVTKSNLDFCCDHTNGCCDSGIGRFQVSLNSDALTLGASGATISTSIPTGTPLASLSSQITSNSLSTQTTSNSLSYTSIVSTSSTIGSEIPSSTSTIISGGSTGLSTGAIVGISVSCVVGGLIILGGVVYFCVKRSSMQSSAGGTKDLSPLHEMDAPNKPVETEVPPAELVGCYKPAEMMA